MPIPSAPGVQQVPPPELRYAEELERLAQVPGPRPPGWRLTPTAVVAFVCGSKRLRVSRKLVGDPALVERCVVTLAGERALLLVGEPGTAKSMLSELLAAAVCGTSALTVQGSAGTTEDQLRYGWNYAQLLARGPSAEALVPSPVMSAMSTGRVARVEEITRCLPEVQDALVSVLSERRLAVPELGEYAVHAAPGFCLIATANLRDRGVTEMSAALKRRFSFETVRPIRDAQAEIALVTERTRQVLEAAGAPVSVDAVVVETLVTAFRDLRSGVSQEGWAVERPTTVLSTAEAVAVSGSIALAGAFFPHARDGVRQIPGQLLGAVRKDDAEDGARLLAYWDAVVKRRAAEGRRTWKQLWELRDVLAD
ncbi:ATP-binding protein [Actinomyces weissii]|uniref:AAA family ATPase n=1 Tax=Actinomyces weissii TaxID=675090 RepID=A0A7T7S200_9ACTO|nr:AAA family ATPase [Actinomyces weissii]QQM66929.1 AAA family ATPase [Actinomyces weissii]